MWRKYAEITEFYGVNLAGISCWAEIFFNTSNVYVDQTLRTILTN